MIVLSAVFILLGKEDLSWKNIKKEMTDVAFLKKLTNFNCHVSPAILKKLRKITSKDTFLPQILM